MVDLQLDLAANTDRQPGEHVQGVGDWAVGGVFDRHDAEMAVAPVDLLEHGGNAPDRCELDRLAKTPDGCQVAEAVHRTEERNPQVRQQRSASAQQFTEYRPNTTIPQRPPAEAGHPGERFLFLLETVRSLPARLLQIADFQSQP